MADYLEVFEWISNWSSLRICKIRARSRTCMFEVHATANNGREVYTCIIIIINMCVHVVFHISCRRQRVSLLIPCTWMCNTHIIHTYLDQSTPFTWEIAAILKFKNLKFRVMHEPMVSSPIYSLNSVQLHMMCSIKNSRYLILSYI